MSIQRNEAVRMVNEVLVEEFELEEDALQPQATLFEDLGLDSLDAVDMIVLIEKRMGFRMEDEEARQIRTLDDLYNFIVKHADNSNATNPPA